ncbi:MAG: MBL fold metallo-hydrolase [Defluviitaleaceae bacterium]|nr:MBL fold metallo-hydrolase [Defluviitaleaceae bacterium]
MKIEKIGKRNIVFQYALPEWNLNLHLILGDKYNYIIDTGLGSDSVAPIKEYIGNSKKPIIVINTHNCWDHIWGNHCFSECNIISHSLCRPLIEEQWSEMLKKNESYIRGEVKMCLPNLLFDNSLYFPDDKIRIFHTPGHTIDSISVLDEQEKVLNAGDNVGDTIEEIVPALYYEKDAYIKSVQKYKELDFAACVSGHNDVLGKDVFDKIDAILHSKDGVR